jgi:hypothetical protein
MWRRTLDSVPLIPTIFGVKLVLSAILVVVVVENMKKRPKFENDQRQPPVGHSPVSLHVIRYYS